MTTATDIAEILEETAKLLDLAGENPFRSRAYTNASRLVKSAESNLEDFIEKALEGKVKGLGKALSESIDEIYRTGTYETLEELRAQFPPGVLEMLHIPGLGAKKVRKLFEEEKLESIGELEAACRADRISELKGFGKKTQENILAGIERLHRYAAQHLYSRAEAQAEELLRYLEEHCDKIEVAGSLRRKKEVVKDVDIVATSKSPSELMDYFVQYPAVDSVSSHGETKSSVVLKTGLSVDLRVVAPEHFTTTLAHFTGSKDHNTHLRSRALARGLKLSEYGLVSDEGQLELSSEEDLYHKLELSFVPPELREDQGEIEEAEHLFQENKTFPRLIENSDLKGILHCHSTYSDGKHSIREMAIATQQLGYTYLGITDHSQTAAYAGGLKVADIKRQHQEIDELNQELAPFKIFKGIESDILKDGSLDYANDVLESFDFIIASVHSSFEMSESEMTKRIITALENPHTTILGHMTGRLLLKREPYAVNIPAVLESASQNKVAIELNANPMRLDIDWRHLRSAKKLNIPIPINPDAHSIKGLEYMRYGVGVARKGGLTKKDVLNTQTAAELDTWFQKT